MSSSSAPSEPEDEEACVRGARRRRPGRASEEEPERRSASAGRRKDARLMQRSAANARERARMRVLSKAFSRLKGSLPWVPADTKLSKLDTLRLASSYICHLRQLLQEERLDGRFTRPVTLTWPFLTTGRSEDVSPPLRLCGATA